MITRQAFSPISFAIISCFILAACSGTDGPSGDADAAGPADAPPQPDDPRWQRLPDVGQGPVQEIGVAELDGKIYVVGGFNDRLGLLDTVQVYDIASQTWSTAAPLPRPVHHANVASADGKLYVLGALIDLQFNETDESWAYDPATDTWVEVASMGTGARGSGAAATIDGKIYLAGGWRDSAAVTDFSVYDPALDTWDHTLPPLADPRDHLVAAAIGTEFYAVSGRAGAIASINPRLDSYDTTTGTWTERTSIPTARGGMAGGVVDGQIIVVGGEGAANPSGVFAQVEVYDPQTDTWSDAGVMPTPRHGMGAAGYEGSLYVPGGADEEAFAAIATFEVFTPTAQ